MTKIADIRSEYKLLSLDESDVNKDPISQFGIWWDAAISSKIDEVNAMTLATVSSNGDPSARIVLLKGYNEKGFIFFTNYESDKAIDLLHHPKASLLFFWKELQRQVRIEGIAEKVSDEESNSYFDSRPEGSRIGAWASPQSRTVKSRAELETKFLDYQQQFKEKNIPRPPHWGGYRIKPHLIEFWQGRPNRLHDRIQYTLQNNGDWKIERLAP